jgi:hypothetical protein
MAAGQTACKEQMPARIMESGMRFALRILP